MAHVAQKSQGGDFSANLKNEILPTKNFPCQPPPPPACITMAHPKDTNTEKEPQLY